ncbi:hypothetical protein SDC9_68763 [bioreactor metagenome]|uniref:Uncharacterized protein n=1 Tax=bioreactor metagenome TaxID=1076179 RepID=A0A644Y310_9ZZZZ
MPLLWQWFRSALISSNSETLSQGANNQLQRFLISACPAGSLVHRVGSTSNMRLTTSMPSSRLASARTSFSSEPSSATALPTFSSMVVRSAAKASIKAFTPSTSRSSVTFSMLIPSSFKASIWVFASGNPFSIVSSALPCSAKAVRVCGGTVFTESGPISSST